MNERIRELIVRSNGYWEHGDGNMPSTVCFQEEDLKKFAELIVLACSEYMWTNEVEWTAAKEQQMLEYFDVDRS